jgi:hypothetical protein
MNNKSFNPVDGFHFDARMKGSINMNPQFQSLYPNAMLIKILLRQGYLVVETLDDVMSIPEEDKKEGMIVFVNDEKRSYRLVVGEWQLVDVHINLKSTLDINHFNFFVDSAGDDNNDGKTITTAWKTLMHAIQNMPSVISGAQTTLTLGEGEWLFTNEIKEILSRFIIDHRFNIRGTYQTILTGLSGTVDSGNPWKRNFPSGTFTESQYKGYFTANGFPIANHGTDFLITSALAGTVTGIKEHKTTIVFEGDRIIPSLRGNMNLRFEDLVFKYSLNQFVNGSDNVELFFSSVVFSPQGTNIQTNFSKSVELTNCLVNSNVTTQPAVNILKSFDTRLNSCIIINNATGSGNRGIHVRGGIVSLNDVVIDNFDTAICGAGDTSISIQEGRMKGVAFMNVINAFELRSGFFRWIHNDYFTALAEQSKLYFFNVTNLINNRGAKQDIYLNLRERIVGSFTNLYKTGSVPFEKLISIEDLRIITYPGSETFELSNYLIRDTIEERDAIHANNRNIGLKVYVISDNKEYRLVGGVENVNWVEV